MIFRILKVSTILSLAIILTSCWRSEDKMLKTESEVKLKITHDYAYKGVIAYNDSIVVSSNCPQIYKDYNKTNYYGTIKNLSVPFELIKKRGSDTLIIVKNYDSLYFKIMEF